MKSLKILIWSFAVAWSEKTVRCFFKLCVIIFYICWFTFSCCLKLIVVYFRLAFLLCIPLWILSFHNLIVCFLVAPHVFPLCLAWFWFWTNLLIMFCCFFPSNLLMPFVAALLSKVLRSRLTWLLQFVCFQWAQLHTWQHS